MTYSLVFGAAFVLAWGITGLVRRYAIHANIVDVPNHRSSHSVVTPRGGGLSIVIVVIAFLVVPQLGQDDVSPGFLALIVSLPVVAGIGFVDDYKHVHAAIRFVCHAIAASMLVTAVGGLSPIQIGEHLVDLGVAGDVIAVVFVIWFTNLFNFMDGIDGIAGVEAVSIAGSMLLLTGLAGNELSASLIVVVGATLGFLVWNWPTAKIFMGDAGSGFLGFLLAAIALLFHATQLSTVWPWLILGGVFIVDATVTLLVRMLRGDAWHSAHRSHSYQILSRKAGGHAAVTLGVLAVNTLWLLPFAWFAHNHVEAGWWLTLIAWLPLLAIALRVGAGRPDSH